MVATSRRPSALRHGLTSRTARQEYADDVKELAAALIGAGPHEPAVLAAAREEAEAILYLRRVQQCRLNVMEDGALKRCAPTEEEMALATKLSVAVKRGDVAQCRALREDLRVVHDREWVVDIETAAAFILGEELGARAHDLRRLGEYERRAHSARRKALRRLDYERVEVERRRVAGEAAEGRGPGAGVACAPRGT